MASQLKTYLALQGCELTVIFHDAKTWDGCQQLADADIMMGDRLIGEAPEYTLEQWLRCDALAARVKRTGVRPFASHAGCGTDSGRGSGSARGPEGHF
jgi:MarR-like DNA-binding transcriptional regulator SgrR of sgrS sRNA